MFIEVHRPAPITINVNKIEYFVPADNGEHTKICLPDCADWLNVEESYAKVKELIEECQKK